MWFIISNVSKELKTHTIDVWYIYLHFVDFMVIVGKYTIHACYGKWFRSSCGRISRISEHYGSSHLPGDIMEKHLGDPLETSWTIRIVARLWVTLDYYYDNPKHFANIKAIKANLNQFSPCRTGMQDVQTICWFDRNPPPKQRIISKIFTLKENYLKMGIKHLSDFKIHQPEPRHLFGVEYLHFTYIICW